MTGKDLLEELINATRLPQEMLHKELTALLKKHGILEQTCGLDDLRDVLAEYAQEILLEAKEELSSPWQAFKAISGK